MLAFLLVLVACIHSVSCVTYSCTKNAAINSHEFNHTFGHSGIIDVGTERYLLLAYPMHVIPQGCTLNAVNLFFPRCAIVVGFGLTGFMFTRLETTTPAWQVSNVTYENRPKTKGTQFGPLNVIRSDNVPLDPPSGLDITSSYKDAIAENQPEYGLFAQINNFNTLHFPTMEAGSPSYITLTIQCGQPSTTPAATQPTQPTQLTPPSPDVTSTASPQTTTQSPTMNLPQTTLSPTTTIAPTDDTKTIEQSGTPAATIPRTKEPDRIIDVTLAPKSNAVLSSCASLSTSLLFCFLIATLM
ncbi:hypothetical protein AKO1_013599 [Acrasis kona]|uniref:Uncharacterized protein n=1 Tax=Acrasis kona TaxID=1008807 RepID=A0AAW2YUY6_9EUKA